MAVEIIKRTDTSYTINGKLVYEDMQGNIVGRVNLTNTELTAFNTYYTAVLNHKKAE